MLSEADFAVCVESFDDLEVLQERNEKVFAVLEDGGACNKRKGFGVDVPSEAVSGHSPRSRRVQNELEEASARGQNQVFLIQGRVEVVHQTVVFALRRELCQSQIMQEIQFVCLGVVLVK